MRHRPIVLVRKRLSRLEAVSHDYMIYNDGAIVATAIFLSSASVPLTGKTGLKVLHEKFSARMGVK